MENSNLYKVLPVNYHPQQNEFEFDNIKFTSNFDSGNLLNVKQLDHNTVIKFITYYWFNLF